MLRRLSLGSLVSIFLFASCGSQNSDQTPSKEKPRYELGIDGKEGVTVEFSSVTPFDATKLLDRSKIKTTQSFRICGSAIPQLKTLSVAKPACCGGGGQATLKLDDKSMRAEGSCWVVDAIPFPISVKTTFTCE